MIKEHTHKQKRVWRKIHVGKHGDLERYFLMWVCTEPLGDGDCPYQLTYDFVMEPPAGVEELKERTKVGDAR